MAWTLTQQSQQGLAQVLTDYARNQAPGAPDAETCENLGRMLITLYRNMAHPACMFHLIAQMSGGKTPDVEALTSLAWAIAESGPGAVSGDSGAGRN